MNEILQKIDRELWTELPETILRKIAATAEEPLASESELREIERLNASYKKFEEVLDKHGPAAAKETFLGQTVKPGAQQPLKSRATIDEEFAETRSSCKRQMLSASAKAHPIAIEILKRFTVHCSRLADRFEAEERAACERFGIDWAPSAVVRVLRQAPGAARNRLPKSPGVSLMSPAKMLRFLPPA